MEIKKVSSFLVLGILIGGSAVAAWQIKAQTNPADNPTTLPNVQVQSQGGADNSRVATTSDSEVKENGKEENDSATDQTLAASAKITADQAKTAAISAAGATAGTVSKVELENENGQVVYGVEFKNNGLETDVKINAVDGKVIKIEKDQNENEKGGVQNTENENDTQPSQEGAESTN